MWGEALAMAVPVAVMMGFCGALLAMVLTGQPLPRRSIGIGVVVVTVVATGGAVANGLHITVPSQDCATVRLAEEPSADGKRMISADVQLNPPTRISGDPDWVSILSWQGRMENDRGLVIDRLERVGPGHYRSTQPIPVWGDWKTLLRVHGGTTLAAVPIYMPADSAIPAPEVPAQASSTRNFVPETAILQRERNQNSPIWLWNAGSILVLILTLLVIAGLTWGAGRINATELGAKKHNEVPRPEPTPAGVIGLSL